MNPLTVPSLTSTATANAHRRSATAPKNSTSHSLGHALDSGTYRRLQDSVHEMYSMGHGSPEPHFSAPRRAATDTMLGRSRAIPSSARRGVSSFWTSNRTDAPSRVAERRPLAETDPFRIGDTSTETSPDVRAGSPRARRAELSEGEPPEALLPGAMLPVSMFPHSLQFPADACLSIALRRFPSLALAHATTLPRPSHCHTSPIGSPSYLLRRLFERQRCRLKWRGRGKGGEALSRRDFGARSGASPSLFVVREGAPSSMGEPSDSSPSSQSRARPPPPLLRRDHRR